MTDTDLSAMLERCEKATEGWYREGNTGTVRYGSGRPVAFVESTLQDADFIAHARTDLPLVVKELQTALYDLGEVSASEREARVLYHSTFAQLEQAERELQEARRLLDNLEEWRFVSRTAQPGDILVACFWRRQTDDVVPPIEPPPGWTFAGIQVHAPEGVSDVE